MYCIFVHTHPFTATCQNWFHELLKTKICLVQPLVTLNSYSCSFQYNILNNFLYLNNKLFTFQKSTSPPSSLCKLSDETMLHPFQKGATIQNLWNDLLLFFQNDLALFDLRSKVAFTSFLNVNSKYWYSKY